MGGSAKILRGQALAVPAKSHWPVVVGSFLTGVAAMTLMGVAAPTIAAARAPQEQALTDAAERAMTSSPEALIEITEIERQKIERDLAAADETLAASRESTNEALARLKALSR